MIGTIFILEGPGRACLASYIGHECVSRKVKIADSVEEGKIKSSTFIGQILCHERSNEEWAISWVTLGDEFQQLSPNLGNGHTSVDGFDFCYEELLVPIHGDRQ